MQTILRAVTEAAHAVRSYRQVVAIYDVPFRTWLREASQSLSGSSQRWMLDFLQDVDALTLELEEMNTPAGQTTIRATIANNIGITNKEEAAFITARVEGFITNYVRATAEAALGMCETLDAVPFALRASCDDTEHELFGKVFHRTDSVNGKPSWASGTTTLGWELEDTDNKLPARWAVGGTDIYNDSPTQYPSARGWSLEGFGFTSA